MELKDLNPKQQKELSKILTEDILERFDNEEYWDQVIITDFLQEEEAKLTNQLKLL